MKGSVSHCLDTNLVGLIVLYVESCQIFTTIFILFCYPLNCTLFACNSFQNLPENPGCLLRDSLGIYVRSICFL